MAGAVDEDTKRTVAQGRATVGSMLSSAQDDLKKAFMVFVVGFLGTFYALRIFIWDQLKRDLNTNPDIEVIAVTPFDVILLQAKIGIVVGILMAIPVVVYYGRDALRVRGWWPAEDVPRWKVAGPALMALVLFVAGIAYAYNLFFPLMLGFLASNAVKAGFQPSWSIVKWTQFITFLSLSFGLAAQLPLVMSGLSYLRIVSYESFRDRWRYAVVGIFAFGAMFSPPDPITQIMWALPLIALYGFSLLLARFAQLLRRSTDELHLPDVARNNWNGLAGVAVLAFGGVYLFFTRGGVAAVNDGLARLPDDVRIFGDVIFEYEPAPLPGLGEATGLDPAVAAAIAGAVVATVAVMAALFVFAFRALEAARDPTERRGSPTEIDVLNLDAGAIPVAPPEVFEEMDEAEATELAREALDEQDDPEKAQAILDRYDEVQEQLEAQAAADGESPGADAGAGADAGGGGTDDDTGAFTSATTGMVDSFTEEETTEDDIGGYYRDIAFILESVTSRAFRIGGVFIAVMTVTFVYLYRGGIDDIRRAFVSRMPEGQGELVRIVTLHPVEALIFEIKFATLLGLVATLPLVLYYAWPRLKERGLVGGDRRVLLVWGVTLVVGLVGGSLLGFLVVAPAIISYLSNDIVAMSMVPFYRISNFGWLVVFTTVGIGLLVEIPVTMFLFHRGGLVPFEAMFDNWRSVVMGIVVAAAVFTPSSLLTMMVLSIPTAFAYLFGLGVLYVYTLGGRRTPRRESEAAD
jgi:sec-independent protein translocase protein TatC